MCYSAQVEAAYKKLGRRYHATVDFDEFVNLYLYHPTASRPLTPRALDLSFSASDGGAAAVIAKAVQQWDELESRQLEELVFSQRTRLVNAERGRLLSFAAITDEPPPEVAEAGHDRCIVQIKPENIDAWLNPDPRSLAACYEILDDRPRPYYEHRLEA